MTLFTPLQYWSKTNPPITNLTTQFIYRITTAPELCHGLFTTSSSDYEPHHLTDAETAKVAPLVESSSSRKQILIAHAVGTLSANETITDEDMLLPPAWMDGGAPEPDMLDEPLPIMGNQDLGGRVAMLHSLAVLPKYVHRPLLFPSCLPY